MALDDTILAEALEAAYLAKLAEHVGPPFENMDPNFKETFLKAMAEANAEQINKHLREHANVKVLVIGLDSGTSLPQSILDALALRGDGAPPFAPPDAGLQQDSTVVDTTPGATSAVLSMPALIE